MHSSLSVIPLAAIAAVGGFLFGFDTGVIGGAQLYFTEYFSLSPSQQGWAVGSALYGCFFGALVAGYLTKAISRKYTLVLSAILFCISAWGSGAANSLDSLVLYRILGGIGIGLASMAAPMYIAEISPPQIRGRMVTLYQLAIVFGFFSVFLTTYYLGGGSITGLSEQELADIHQHNLNTGWKWMFWSELIPAMIFLVALCFVPHSPRWLAMKNRDEEALSVLRRLNENAAEAQLSLSQIKKSLSEKQITHIKKLIISGLGFATLIGVLLSILQQITGINAILYYGAEIFSKALGYGPQDALKQQLWLGAVNVLFTFIALFTVDKWGRKPLYLIGTFGMFVGLSVLAITIYAQTLGLLSLVAIFLFIGSFAMSMGPIVWVVLSEMFPNNARSLAMAIAVSAQWLFNGIVASTFPVVNRSELNEHIFSGALPYFIFAAFCILALVFAWKFLPETKGKTLEEIEDMWVQK